MGEAFTGDKFKAEWETRGKKYKWSWTEDSLGNGTGKPVDRWRGPFYETESTNPIFAYNLWYRLDEKEMENNMSKKMKRSGGKHSQVGNRSGVLPSGTTVWKGVDLVDENNNFVQYGVAKMVTIGDGVVPANDTKCRAPKVVVLSITGADGKEYTEARANADHNFKYTVGEFAVPANGFDTSRTQCSAGIHCFRTRAQAKAYFGIK